MTKDYTKYFTNEAFWDKVKQYGKKAGLSVVYAALLLFYVLQKKDVPTKVKMSIFGALGYFIFPIDIIPDVIPVVGYGDDLTALIGAIAIATFYIDEEVKQQAKVKLMQWFGKDIDFSKVEEKLKIENKQEAIEKAELLLLEQPKEKENKEER
ncbi:MAG: YkvA family protein [Bacillaceae bacterium]